MIEFTLGLLVGVVWMGITVFLVLAFKTSVNRKMSEIEAFLKPKGRIIEPENNEVESWLDGLKNDVQA